MLFLVATPIGDPDELTLRALKVLREADVILCESTKDTSKLLRHHGLSGKTYELLNEHSRPEELPALVELCRQKIVALVSDGGTPAFCDPGADLVALCRRQNIPIQSVLGPSSLMGLLSLAGERLDEFVFRGFLPAETEARRQEWAQLRHEDRALILMDTPYRLKKLLAEAEEFIPDRSLFLVRDLSLPSEKQLEGKAQDLRRLCGEDKAEFMLLVRPRDKKPRPRG